MNVKKKPSSNNNQSRLIPVEYSRSHCSNIELSNYSIKIAVYHNLHVMRKYQLSHEVLPSSSRQSRVRVLHKTGPNAVIMTVGLVALNVQFLFDTVTNYLHSIHREICFRMLKRWSR